MTDRPTSVRFSPDIFLAQQLGGVTRYFVEIMARLPHHGVDVLPLRGLHRSAFLPSRTGSVELPPLLQTPRGIRAAEHANVSITRALACAADTVFHPTYYSSPLPRRARARVVTVFDMAHERLPSLFPSDPTSASKRRWCATSDVIMTISHATKDELIDCYGVDPARVVVTPLASALPRAGAEVRSHDRPYVLSVGQTWPHKDFGTALRAMAAAELPDDADLVVFGAGTLSEADLQLAASLGLRDRLQTVSGDDRTLDNLYQHAIALIYPSRYEGFGLPILEAMDRGCPVVLSDLAVHREVAGPAGLFFDPGDAVGAAAHLTATLDQQVRAERATMGASNSARFDWEETARLTADAYRQALDRH